MSEPDPQQEQPPKPRPMILRIIWVIGGFLSLLLGLVLALPGVPGPGFVFIIAGLALLAAEFAWARRSLDKLKASGQKVAEYFKKKK
jgi:hypothetical protein